MWRRRLREHRGVAVDVGWAMLAVGGWGAGRPGTGREAGANANQRIASTQLAAAADSNTNLARAGSATSMTHALFVR